MNCTPIGGAVFYDPIYNDQKCMPLRGTKIGTKRMKAKLKMSPI